MNKYFVYILASKTGTIYVGVTNNLIKRVYEHKNKLVDGFTKKYNIDRLVYFYEFSNVKEAIEMEKKIKKWSRQKKLDLILGMNPNTDDLYEKLT